MSIGDGIALNGGPLTDRLRGIYAVADSKKRTFSEFVPFIQLEAADRITALEAEVMELKERLQQTLVTAGNIEAFQCRNKTHHDLIEANTALKSALREAECPDCGSPSIENRSDNNCMSGWCANRTELLGGGV